MDTNSMDIRTNFNNDRDRSRSKSWLLVLLSSRIIVPLCWFVISTSFYYNIIVVDCRSIQHHDRSGGGVDGVGSGGGGKNTRGISIRTNKRRRRHPLASESSTKSSSTTKTKAPTIFESKSAVLSPSVVSSSQPNLVSTIEDNNGNNNDNGAAAAAGRGERVSLLDVAMFVTYFCNIVVLTSSVVTLPAMAIEYNLSPRETATFCAGVASLGTLGGTFGKLLNGFVCQQFGGRLSSSVYMILSALFCFGMSLSTSLKPVGLYILIFEFLSSIQWTAACNVFDQQYRHQPRKMANGIALLSISSTFGALAVKTFGSCLLRGGGSSSWRILCRLCSLSAVIGAVSMYIGGNCGRTNYQEPKPKVKLVKQRIADSKRQRERSLLSSSTSTMTSSSSLEALKGILTNPIFWMVGTGHSLGYIARASDRFLGPFLQEAGGISSSLAAGLTSSVTIGFLLGLIQGNTFSKMESVDGKMNMIRKSYVISFVSTLGLTLCGVDGISKLLGHHGGSIVTTSITVLSGIVAGTVSFQFYQFPNLISSTLFPDNSAVALSLTDAAAYFVAATILGINRLLLGNFGWCSAWAFIATTFGIGGTVITKAIRPVLIQQQQQQQQQCR